MSFFTLRRFCGSLALGFVASPLFRGVAVALCESASGPSASISADGQINHIFDNVPAPTKEELEYVKTWGIPWVDEWDRPGARGIRSDRSTAHLRQIIMIRHGQYENEATEDDSIRRLTPLGEKQARATGVYLRKLFEESEKKKQLLAVYTAARAAYQKVKKEDDAPEKESAALQRMMQADLAVRGAGGIFVDGAPRFVHVSNMVRARQTADLILEAFPAEVQRALDVDPQLQERFPCDVEPKREFHATVEDMKAAEEVFERYFHRPTSDESSVEIIVGHGNVIRYLTMRALQLPPEAWLRTSLPHCSVTTITIRGTGHVSLVGMGSYGHLPPELVTAVNLP
ncbi:putative phosphoglycerate mutase family member 5 [Leptomonas pyrrhocoris]|uniref:Serine/threonine-protein phosphatase PGAM5, mitochondrial n=1 Tax=Leptomonas pyrrhocoris TaxID=157538 RepID=A0A0M9G3E7_LEPPY|nr:putative phosphoglycerate mutase family member 5 [Leptomonas pyrrhocoris]KPA81443.1 putative phosphoglycerate mutase family member 5 [Leptomonas pyrrhocoris]|eukprot:XP_015659882.1 putative phosphoglycerate mutase family member 5 [Leptomonas pyrrhocoris]